jgi:hypothetical protein
VGAIYENGRNAQIRWRSTRHEFELLGSAYIWNESFTFHWVLRVITKHVTYNLPLKHRNTSSVGSQLGAFAKLKKKLLASSCLSVLPHETTVSRWMDFHETPYIRIFESLSRNFKFYKNMAIITNNVHEDLRTFMIVSRWILLRMTMFQTELVQKLKTHISCSITFSSGNRNSYNMWKKIVYPDKTQMTI